MHALGGQAKSIVVADVTYESTDPTIDSQILQLAGSGANVFVNSGTPKFIAQAIRKARDIGWKPLQIVPSTGSSVKSALEPAGLENSIGIITAQYLKDPTDPQWANDAEVAAWAYLHGQVTIREGSKVDYFNAYSYSVASSLGACPQAGW